MFFFLVQCFGWLVSTKYNTLVTKYEWQILQRAEVFRATKNVAGNIKKYIISFAAHQNILGFKVLHLVANLLFSMSLFSIFPVDS